MAGLPPQSAWIRAVDPHGWWWGPTEELLAVLIEVADAGNRMYVQRHLKRGHKLPDPVRIARPRRRQPDTAVEEPPRKKATAAELKRFFGGG